MRKDLRSRDHREYRRQTSSSAKLFSLALERRRAFRKSYLSQFPGYYQTGDGGIIDEDGYVFVMGRVDDVINVAGHRLSTGQMEELIGSHPGVAECAVVGIDDELRGQVPVGFAVLKDGVDMNHQDLEKELVSIIRKEIGAVACFRKSALVKRLPKPVPVRSYAKPSVSWQQPQRFQYPPSMIQPFLMKSVMRCRPVVLEMSLSLNWVWCNPLNQLKEGNVR